MSPSFRFVCHTYILSKSVGYQFRCSLFQVSVGYHSKVGVGEHLKRPWWPKGGLWSSKGKGKTFLTKKIFHQNYIFPKKNFSRNNSEKNIFSKNNSGKKFCQKYIWKKWFSKTIIAKNISLKMFFKKMFLPKIFLEKYTFAKCISEKKLPAWHRLISSDSKIST